MLLAASRWRAAAMDGEGGFVERRPPGANPEEG